MNNNYIKGWGVLVGKFDEKDLNNGLDKQLLKEYQKKYPQYQYNNTKIIKEKGITKLALYICNLEDMKIF